MTKHSIIIDCDPGQDDAVALFLAFAARDELEILGITTVGGNVSVDKTARNALIISELAGVDDIPVYAGCSLPLLVDPVTAPEVHGEEGMDGVEIFTPKRKAENGHAVDFIIDTIMARPDGTVTLVPTGPFTNIAMALRKEPKIVPKIKEIVLMGGALREGGNVTASAEFNVYVDPHAAQIVVSAGVPVVMHGLDVTHQVLSEPARLETIKKVGNKVADSVVDILTCFNRHDTEKYGTEGAPLHDPCTIAYLLKPELFETKPCYVEVETSSPLTLGATSIDFWQASDKPANVHWVHGVDADGFFELLAEYLSRY